MKVNKWLWIGLVSLVASGSVLAQSAADMGEIYKNRCANCHGASAEGVTQLKEMPGVSATKADAQGMASEEQANIHGPALKYFTKEELHKKMIDLRDKGFDAQSYHSVMRQNLKTIEAREGAISDEKMAEYISTTFGD